mmetsp:Transcript_2413/g.10359  ORF Transcript_2413/g.10359 Transcript_2413/m.10359 type:complete len:391 (-) Transcript_2413:147-1319(-)
MTIRPLGSVAVDAVERPGRPPRHRLPERRLGGGKQSADQIAADSSRLLENLVLDVDVLCVVPRRRRRENLALEQRLAADAPGIHRGLDEPLGVILPAVRCPVFARGVGVRAREGVHRLVRVGRLADGFVVDDCVFELGERLRGGDIDRRGGRDIDRHGRIDGSDINRHAANDADDAAAETREGHRGFRGDARGGMFVNRSRVDVTLEMPVQLGRGCTDRGAEEEGQRGARGGGTRAAASDARAARESAVFSVGSSGGLLFVRDEGGMRKLRRVRVAESHDAAVGGEGGGVERRRGGRRDRRDRGRRGRRRGFPLARGDPGERETRGGHVAGGHRPVLGGDDLDPEPVLVEEVEGRRQRGTRVQARRPRALEARGEIRARRRPGTEGVVVR